MEFIELKIIRLSWQISRHDTLYYCSFKNSVLFFTLSLFLLPCCFSLCFALRGNATATPTPWMVFCCVKFKVEQCSGAVVSGLVVSAAILAGRDEASCRLRRL